MCHFPYVTKIRELKKEKKVGKSDIPKEHSDMISLDFDRIV